MIYEDYDYDYHNLAESADDLYDDRDEGYSDVPDEDYEDDYMGSVGYEYYYHDIAEELDD